MAFLKFHLTEVQRVVVVLVLIAVNFTSTAVLVGLIGYGFHIYHSLQSKAQVSGKSLLIGIPAVIYTIVGLILIVIHFALCYAIYYARFAFI